MRNVLKEFDGRYLDGCLRRLWNRAFILGAHWQDFVAAATSASEGAVVLDAGAGECPFRPRFQGCRQYVAIDLLVGDPAYDFSRIDVIADLKVIPLADESVDVVFCTQVLEHLPAPHWSLGEFHRVLRPGGHLLLSTNLLWPEHQQPYDFFRFTRFGLEHLFTSAGFERLQLQPMGGFFSVCRLIWHHLWADTHLWRPLWLRLPSAPVRWLLRKVGTYCLAPLCYALDKADKEKEFTLGYFCHAYKPVQQLAPDVASHVC